MRFLSLLVVGLLLGGCIRVEMARELRFERPAAGAIEGLKVGESDVEASLAALGAPLWVWEQPTPEGDGVAMAWGWYRNRSNGFRISVPAGRVPSPSFDYGESDERLEGVVLFFDHDWRLTSFRTGLLVDLTRDLDRRRPAHVEDESDYLTTSIDNTVSETVLAAPPSTF
jgi:hypothetical protein